MNCSEKHELTTSESTASLQCRQTEAQVTKWYTDCSFWRQRQRESIGRLAAMASPSFPLCFKSGLWVETFRNLLVPSFFMLCLPSELTVDWLDTETRGLIFMFEGFLTTGWSKLALLLLVVGTFADACWSRLALLRLGTFGAGPDLLLETNHKFLSSSCAYKMS